MIRRVKATLSKSSWWWCRRRRRGNDFDYIAALRAKYDNDWTRLIVTRMHLDIGAKNCIDFSADSVDSDCGWNEIGRETHWSEHGDLNRSFEFQASWHFNSKSGVLWFAKIVFHVTCIRTFFRLAEHLRQTVHMRTLTALIANEAKVLLSIWGRCH